MKFGDIWRYTSTTDAMKAFVEQPSLTTLHKAMSAHKALVRDQKQGDDEFYLGALVLKKLFNEGNLHPLALASFMMLLTASVTRFSKRFLLPDLWVSNIATFEGVEVAGRGATKLYFLGDQNIGGII